VPFCKMKLSLFTFLLIAVFTFYCRRTHIEKPTKTSPESCWNWTQGRTIYADLTLAEINEYFDLLYIHHKEPPSSQFGPRALDDRIDGYKIARTQLFGGRLFKDDDIICQIQEFNFVSSCSTKFEEAPNPCWEKELSKISSKLQDLANNRKSLLGSQAELHIYRNGSFQTLIIRIVQ
jgi:hypothetical protein